MTPALSTAALGFFGFICPTSARSEERSANKIVQIKELSEMSPNLDQSPRLVETVVGGQGLIDFGRSRHGEARELQVYWPEIRYV